MLGLVLIGALVWAITLACGQSVIHVCPNGTDVPSCGAGTACETIKYAIEQRASAFTEIVLCDGEFGASSCNATIGGPISVTGAGLNDTIIDCAFEHPAFQYLGDPANMSFSGFTIRYAVASNASLLGPVGGGIGIVWSSPNIANQSVSVIVDNLSFINCSAGSLYVDGAFVTLGGGLGLLVDTTMDYFSVTVSNCTFDGNEVDNFDSGISFGAAFGLQISSPVLASVITIVNSSFTNNYATGAAYGEGAIALVLDGSTSNCEVSLSGITVSNNYADYGGGVYFEMDGQVFEGSVAITNSDISGNFATLEGGGLYMEQYGGFVNCTLVVSSTVLSNNQAVGDGAGVLLYPTGAPAVGVLTFDEGLYPAFDYSAFFTFESCVIVGNSVIGPSANGGGIAMYDGGQLTLHDCLVANNSAVLHGGGVYVGQLSSSLFFTGVTTVYGNTASVGGGEQVTMLSGGAVGLDGLQAVLRESVLDQIIVQQGGNVTLSPVTLLQCPVGSQFQDLYGGLYGDNATVQVVLNFVYRRLVSTMAIVCTSCPSGTYTLTGGYSDGSPGKAHNPPCLPCPYGGTCTSIITSSRGYWGAVVSSSDGSQSIEFAQCPQGYCCGSGVPCTSINTCEGHRRGRLCGECEPGYGEVVASSTCRLIDECDDGAWFWPIAVIVLLLAGVMMLKNSEIILPSKVRPTGKARLSSYAFQQFPLLLLGTVGDQSNFTQAMDGILSVLRFSPPSTGNGRGVCIIPNMSLSMKLSLGYLIPVLVAVSMFLMYFTGKLFLEKTKKGAQFRQWLSAREEKRRQRQAAKSATLSPTLGGLVALGPNVSMFGPAANRLFRTVRPTMNPLQAVAVAQPSDASEPRQPVTSAGVSEWTESSNEFQGLSISQPVPHTGIVTLPLKERLKGGAVNLALFGYSAILSSTLKLLSCVNVPGSPSTYLFLNGNQDCADPAWRGPLLLVVFIVIGFVVALPLWTMRLHRIRLVNGRGMHRVLCEMYTPQCYLWESLLVGQRLLLALLAVFGEPMPVLRLLLAGLLLLASLLAHIIMRPLSDPAAQRLQVVFQACLLLCVMCNIAPAVKLQSSQGLVIGGAADNVSTNFANVMQIACAYIVPLVAIALSVPVSAWLSPLSVIFR